MKITMSRDIPKHGGVYLWSELGDLAGIKIALVHSWLSIGVIEKLVVNLSSIGGYWCEIESTECADNIPTLGDADRVVGPTDFTDYIEGLLK